MIPGREGAAVEIQTSAGSSWQLLGLPVFIRVLRDFACGVLAGNNFLGGVRASVGAGVMSGVQREALFHTERETLEEGKWWLPKGRFAAKRKSSYPASYLTSFSPI